MGKFVSRREDFENSANSPLSSTDNENCLTLKEETVVNESQCEEIISREGNTCESKELYFVPEEKSEVLRNIHIDKCTPEGKGTELIESECKNEIVFCEPKKSSSILEKEKC